MPHEKLVFISYSQQDNNYENQALSQFRDALSKSIEFVGGIGASISVRGPDFEIGRPISEQNNRLISEAVILVPVLTPNFFHDKRCRDALQRFLEREHQSGYHLILPVHYQQVSGLDPTPPGSNPLIHALRDRHMIDWKPLRGKPFDTKEVRAELERLAERIHEIVAELPELQPANTESNGSDRTSVRPWDFLRAQGLSQIDETTYTHLFQVNDRDHDDRARERYHFIPMPILNQYSNPI